MASIFYDVNVMGFKVQILPYKIIIYDKNDEIDSNIIPNNIVKYCLSEGFCDAWANDSKKIRIEIFRTDK